MWIKATRGDGMSQPILNTDVLVCKKNGSFQVMSFQKSERSFKFVDEHGEEFGLGEIVAWDLIPNLPPWLVARRAKGLYF